MEDPQAVTNPTVLFEVLSPSTEEYDRGEKLEHYKKVPSLREVVFVAHDGKRVDVVRRLPSSSASQPDAATWATTTARARETVRLESLDCDLPVDEIYRDPLAGE
jgi:Uma2 family endonuclease